MASTPVTTPLVSVSTPTIQSDELVPDNVNSSVTRLPVSPIFPRGVLPINIGYPNPNPRHQVNIFRSRNRDANKNQQTSLEGTSTSVTTVAINNSPTPEQVITQIETLKATGGQKRTDGIVNQFTTLQCRLIRVGSYRVNKCSHNPVTISDIGILFDLPHSQIEGIVRCAVPADQVLTVYAHYSARLPLLVVTTTPGYAAWLRGRLGMTDDPGMPNCFCPLKGGSSQKHLMLMLHKFTAMDIGFINKFYKRTLVELNYVGASTLLMKMALEGHTPGDDQVGVHLNNREPQPPVSTEILIESRPIKAEDMSAAGLPLGKMMGAETQETAGGNSQTPVNLNLTPAAANTVKNSVRAKADSVPDWEPEPGPSRNKPKSTGTIKRPTTAGNPRTPTKRVTRDDNASEQSSD